MKRLLVVFAFVATSATSAVAGESFLRVEVGQHFIHETTNMPGASLRVGTAEKFVIVETGLTISGTGYGGLDGALYLTPCSSCEVRPFVGVQAGYMMEDDYSGLFTNAVVGIDFRSTRRVGGYVVGRVGRHDGQAGPSTIGGGLLVRFGGNKTDGSSAP